MAPLSVCHQAMTTLAQLIRAVMLSAGGRIVLGKLAKSH